MSSSQPKLDLTKPVTTRDGRAVRILCTDRKGTTSPVVGLITDNNRENFCSWDLDGKYIEYGNSPSDLINPKKKLYLLVWDSPSKKHTCVSYDSDEERTTAIAVCKKHGWKVNKVFEIEVD